jgi:hypothetical protein
MDVAAPKFRFEWNLNTIWILAAICAGFVAWGYTLNEMQTGRAINANNIAQISDRVKANELSLRRLDTQELRLATIEKEADSSTLSMKALETTLNGLASDVRVTKEILLRLESAQKTRYQP